MNREQRRWLQRQGAVNPDGTPAAPDTRARKEAMVRQQTARRERTTPLGYVKEVRAELRKVAWPSRDEVVNYSVIVLVTLIVMMALIFALDFVFARSILFIFET